MGPQRRGASTRGWGSSRRERPEPRLGQGGRQVGLLISRRVSTRSKPRFRHTDPDPERQPGRDVQVGRGGATLLAPTKPSSSGPITSTAGTASHSPRLIASGVQAYSTRWKPCASNVAKRNSTSCWRASSSASAHRRGRSARNYRISASVSVSGLMGLLARASAASSSAILTCQRMTFRSRCRSHVTSSRSRAILASSAWSTCISPLLWRARTAVIVASSRRPREPGGAQRDPRTTPGHSSGHRSWVASAYAYGDLRLGRNETVADRRGVPIAPGVTVQMALARCAANLQRVLAAHDPLGLTRPPAPSLLLHRVPEALLDHGTQPARGSRSVRLAQASAA